MASVAQLDAPSDWRPGAGVILEGDLGEKVSLSWLTSPYLELRDK